MQKYMIRGQGDQKAIDSAESKLGFRLLITIISNSNLFFLTPLL